MLLLGGFLPPVDFFIVNVALPSIRSELGASSSQMQLVISGYAAGYAVLLISGGRLGDLFGRRRLFLIGMTCFTLTSALCGLAGSAELLVVGRVLEGLSAAVLVPQVLGSIRGLYEGAALGRALAIYGAMMGLAAACGQLLGGTLVAADLFGLGWRVVFLVNLPLGLIALVGARLAVRETSAAARPRLDPGGALLVSLALACLVVPLSEGPARGWPWWSVLMLAASFPILAAFLGFEARLARLGGMPLVDPALLRIRSFRRGVLLCVLFFCTSPFYLLFSVYQQSGLGTDPLRTGLAILPYGLGLFIGAMGTTPLPARLRPMLFGLGLAIELAGYALVALCAFAGETGPVAELVLFVAGTGQGIAMPRVFNAVLAEVPPAQAGLAAGIANTMLQMGAAISTSAVGSLFFALLGAGAGAAAYGRALGVSMLAVVAAIGAALVMAVWPVRGTAVADRAAR